MKILLNVFLIVTLIVPISYAQDFWQHTKGPYGGYVGSLAINSSGHIYAGTEGGIVFCSTNNGDSWIETNLTNFNASSLAINSTGHIIAGNGNVGVVYRSTDNGDNWVQIGLMNDWISSLAINSNGHIFARTWIGIFLSTNYIRWIVWDQMGNRHSLLPI